MNLQEHLIKIITQHRVQEGLLTNGWLLCGYPDHEVCDMQFPTVQDWAVHLNGILEHFRSGFEAAQHGGGPDDETLMT